MEDKLDILKLCKLVFVLCVFFLLFIVVRVVDRIVIFIINEGVERCDFVECIDVFGCLYLYGLCLYVCVV